MANSQLAIATVNSFLINHFRQNIYQFRSFGNRKSAIAPPLRLLAGVLWSAWLGLGLGLGL